MEKEQVSFNEVINNIQGSLSKKKFYKADLEKLTGATLYKGQCMYVLNYVDQIVSFQKGVKEMLGYSEQEYTFDFVLNNYHPDDINVAQRVLSAALLYNVENKINRKDTLLKLCYRLRKKNGDYIKVLRTSTTLEINTEGNLVSNISTLTDISFLNMGNKVVWDFDSIGLNKAKFRKYITKSFASYFSERQVEIIRLMAQGHSSSDISKILSISKHTVDTHRRVLLQKSNSQNTIELLNFCAHNGVI
ncbi:MAG: LuxR C-terminal-related transcriptional regulator [Bacteroidota bacterium]|nr:LuxR C-terminal-related transcriptional regulator [Bacteroidota bacterium]